MTKMEVKPFSVSDLTEAINVHNRALDQVKQKLRTTSGLTVSYMDIAVIAIDELRRDVHSEIVAGIIKHHIMGGLSGDVLHIAGVRDPITYETLLTCADEILKRLTSMGLIRTNGSL